MTHTITLSAHAKINLFLDITGRRADGYHTITGIMQAVSLCDTVTVSAQPVPDGTGSIALTCSDPSLPANEKNLGWRAAQAFMDAANRRNLAVIIHIEKHIPAAAGMAGGSTDAAAVLRGLNTLCGKPLGEAALRGLGLRLGADVPFCLAGGTQITEGVGEVLTPASPLPDCDIVIACAGEGVSTPAAYGKLDGMYGQFDGIVYTPKKNDLAAQLKALEQGNLDGACAHAYNIFESAILPDHAVARSIKERLADCGASLAMMSGSGPSVFGLFPKGGNAATAAEALRAQGIPAWVCTAVR